jgi:hypothetical protein
MCFTNLNHEDLYKSALSCEVCTIQNERVLNPLTPELNPSAQRCLTIFFYWRFCFLNRAFRYYMGQKTTNATIILSVYELCMVGATCFGITLPSSGNVTSVCWEMLNWGAVDRILTQHSHLYYSVDCSSVERLSEGTRNAPWGWQCNAETCRRYHT